MKVMINHIDIINECKTSKQRAGKGNFPLLA